MQSYAQIPQPVGGQEARVREYGLGQNKCCETTINVIREVVLSNRGRPGNSRVETSPRESVWYRLMEAIRATTAAIDGTSPQTTTQTPPVGIPLGPLRPFMALIALARTVLRIRRRTPSHVVSSYSVDAYVRFISSSCTESVSTDHERGTRVQPMNTLIFSLSPRHILPARAIFQVGIWRT